MPTTTSATHCSSSAAAPRRFRIYSWRPSSSRSVTSRRTLSRAPSTASPSAPGRFLDRRAVFQRLPPVAMLGVPSNGLAEPALEVDRGFPAELAPELRGIEQVPAIVPGPVRDDRLQARRLAGQLEHAVCNLLDALLDARPDVVGLTHGAGLEDELDRAAVVKGVEPFTAVLGRGIQRERQIVERVGDEERNHLLRELVRPVVVGAVG